MFNKKAIAALAAGATLVSGLAFAAPAMADGKYCVNPITGNTVPCEPAPVPPKSDDGVPGTPAEDPESHDSNNSDLLQHNYKGEFVEILKRLETNVHLYDALLQKLEATQAHGWDDLIKGMGNTCAYLKDIRRKLEKAVLHYGHVEATVKDFQAELEQDLKDAVAKGDFVEAHEVQQLQAKVAPLLKVADNNRTRAAALLDSARDHAKDQSCDTGAKDILNAMKKEPNFPGKKSAAKAPAAAAAKAQAAAPKKAAAPLAKTGAAVALMAVAASVLAGMGAALRKIRH
ncbi:hypothetical protein ACMZ8B_02885 [Gardnerella greenwoodii]|uniref:hypothetical protein n=1 Tax=Gardnerella greenwoodii TaxID=2914925 RepID=UPI0039EFE651